jgi:purine-binding chemotaxis protein CheW
VEIHGTVHTFETKGDRVNRTTGWGNEIQVAVFSLGAEHYGIDIAGVQEIMRVPVITRVPEAPSFVEGVFNFRGRVVPVVDLRQRFGLEDGTQSKASRVVVTDVGSATIGIMVDQVSEILRIGVDKIEAAPSLAARKEASFIKGIAKLEDRLVILIDLERVLSDQEMEQVRDFESTESVGAA